MRRIALIVLIFSLNACGLPSIPGTASTPPLPTVILNDTPVPTATFPATKEFSEPTVEPTESASPTPTHAPIAIPPLADDSQQCDIAWFFKPAPQGCPDQAALASFATTETFEHGLMIYVQDLKQIYVFYGDDPDLTAFDVFPDPYIPGTTPRSDPSIKPPAGRYQPELGFGAVWRGAYDDRTVIPIRDVLGWALNKEYGFNTRYQCGRPVSESACFLRAPDERIIVMAGSQAAYWPPK